MLEIKSFSLKYKLTGHKVINNLSFEVKRGDVVAILGPSGCGKTTLLNSIAGLLTPDVVVTTGKIIVGGPYGFVFQTPCLLPWFSVYKNIVIGLNKNELSSRDIDNKVTGVLKMVGLSKYSDYLPQNLSVGMQQRVNFARALVACPELLLLDEPFSALDRKTKLEIMEEFKKIIKKERITTVFVTHDIEEAKFLASKIIYLEENFWGANDLSLNKELIKKFDYLIEAAE